MGEAEPPGTLESACMRRLVRRELCVGGVVARCLARLRRCARHHVVKRFCHTYIILSKSRLSTDCGLTHLHNLRLRTKGRIFKAYFNLAFDRSDFAAACRP